MTELKSAQCAMLCHNLCKMFIQAGLFMKISFFLTLLTYQYICHYILGPFDHDSIVIVPVWVSVIHLQNEFSRKQSSELTPNFTERHLSHPQT